MESLAQLGELGDLALWSMLVGFFSPLFISALKSSRWSARTQSIVAFAFYVLVGAVTAWLSGIFSTVSLMTAVLLIFVTGATSYRDLWKKTGVTGKIEAVTSRGGDTADPDENGRHEAGVSTKTFPLG